MKRPPNGCIGSLMAAALAAEMSTDSGYLLTWATMIYNDLILPCVKKPLSSASRLLITRSMVLAIGVFLLIYGLWYEMPGNAWDYLAVTGNIYLASVFTLLVAGLYWRRATATGAYAALIFGAIGPITFLVVNLLVVKANALAAHPPRTVSFAVAGLMRFHRLVPNAGSIPPAVAGASSFALAFLGMFIGSLPSRRPAASEVT